MPGANPLIVTSLGEERSRGCFSPLDQICVDGPIAEILGFNRPLSGAEKASVMADLAATWDLEESAHLRVCSFPAICDTVWGVGGIEANVQGG